MYNQGDVLSVDCALLWVVNVASTDVGVLNGIAGGLDVNGDGGSGVLSFPAIA